MLKKLLGSIAIAVVSCMIFQTYSPTAAQSVIARVDLKAPAPRLPNGKPDFSGNWNRPGVQDMTRTVTNANGTSNKGEPNPLPFTTWGQAQWDNYDPVENGDYAGSCMPFGWIRSFTPHPMQILQNSEYISFLFEQSTMFQLVNTEGLPHRKGWPPTWFGDSRGTWDGDTLVIDVVNFNGYQKLGTIGHPMSDQSHLVMTFKRPDMGHIQFKWVLDDPKTYMRPITNERVFVLTPDVEVMEYACMENNLAALLDGGVKPWLGAKDQDVNVLYGTAHDWPAYDLTKQQKLTGVIRELRFRGKPPLVKIEVDRKMLDVVLAPAARMEFRNLEEGMLKPGVTVSVAAYPSKQIMNEFRAETITIGTRTTDLR